MVLEKILGKSNKSTYPVTNSAFGEQAMERLSNISVKQMNTELTKIASNTENTERMKYKDITKLSQKECIPFNEIIRKHPDFTDGKNPNEIVDWLTSVDAPLVCTRRKEMEKSHGIKSAQRLGNTELFDLYSQVKESPSKNKLYFVGRVDDATRRIIGAEVETDLGTSTTIKVPTGRFIKTK